jgi:hypothetical protein
VSELVTVGEDGRVIGRSQVARLNADLGIGVDVSTAARTTLLANAGLAAGGFSPQGNGFVIPPEEASRLRADDAGLASIVRPFMTGADIVKEPRERYLIDFGFMSLSEAQAYPLVLQIVIDRVLPTRAVNKRASYRDFWWRLGEPRRFLREALADIETCVITVYTGKHRPFVRASSAIAYDDTIIVFALEKRWQHAVLSSSIHRHWELSLGGRLEDRPRYNKAKCFDAFPFPLPTRDKADQLDVLADKLHAHYAIIARRPGGCTLTEAYNVVEKLRVGVALTEFESRVNASVACGVLKDLHDSLDAAVAAAYGWPWPMDRDEILERLVALHAERVAEERRGLVRWLRPDYQIPRFGRGLPSQTDADFGDAAPPDIAPTPAQPWPDTVVAQLTAINTLLMRGPLTAADVAASFANARADLVERHLETLAMMGEAVRRADNTYALSRRAA